MYVIGKCKKCNEVIIFDIENRTVKEAKDLMSKAKMGECPGMHVEIGTWADYYSFNWNNIYENKEDAIDAQTSV